MIDRSMDQDEAFEALGRTLARRAGCSVTVAVAADLFPHRSRSWVGGKLIRAADGTEPFPGLVVIHVKRGEYLIERRNP